MTIALPPQVENALKDEAQRHGLPPEAYAARLIAESLPKPNQATLDLFDRWAKEDATDDPQELARRQREGEEFMQNLARNRIEMEGPNARKLWP